MKNNSDKTVCFIIFVSAAHLNRDHIGGWNPLIPATGECADKDVMIDPHPG